MDIKIKKGRHSHMWDVDGIHVGQTPNVIDLFKNIIPQFDTIIEIGTHRGGFTYFFNNIKSKNTELISFEINIKNIDDRVLNSEIDIVIGDCFDTQYEIMIKNKISSGGRTLLLCDGGNKNKEFNTFSKYLKPDDVIMLHDYKDSQQSWNYYCKQNDWNFAPESSYDKISDSINNNNLKKYMYDEFCSVFWGSFIKDNI